MLLFLSSIQKSLALIDRTSARLFDNYSHFSEIDINI